MPTDIESLTMRSNDNPVPWPWGAEMPFPWTFVQGVWLAEYDEFRSFYVFRVVKQKDGLNQLEVKQIDPATCEEVASGVGFDQGTVVRAQMTGRTGGGTYRIALRSFHEKAVRGPVGVPPVHNQYMVLSVIPFDSVKTVSIPIQFVTSRLTFKCRVEQ